MNTKHICMSDYYYDLPDEKIAKFPLAHRDESKLLVYKSGEITQYTFKQLPQLLPQNALMVFNNTKVIQARMHFHKATGAQIEVFLMEPALPTDYEQVFQTKKHCAWYCMIGNLKKWKEGILSRTFSVKNQTFTLSVARKNTEEISVDSSTECKRNQLTHHWVDFYWEADNISFADILEVIGELPIPPYLNRATQESDKQTYQTVYSKIKGSVAAPTAGLHFTEDVLKELDNCHIQREEVTLHVGAGTFKPVKSATISGHDMHTEYICVSKHTIEQLIKYDAKAIAVGTTSVRTLESLYYIGVYLSQYPNAEEHQLHVHQWQPYEQIDSNGLLVKVNGKLVNNIQPVDALQHILQFLTRHSLQYLHTSTQIIIVPGYKYKIVKQLITNFHQPQSTLLLLVSAFVKGEWKEIYNYALEHDFRFLSYGDSSLLIP